MMRKPLFWIIFAVFVAGCCLFIAKYGTRAFNVLEVETTMDRASALKAAAEVHARIVPDMAQYRSAAVFSNDGEFQDYVELEGGGKSAFTKVVQSGVFHPYYWYVRHFIEGEIHEVYFTFSPKGQPIGFEEKIAETAPGAAPDSITARTIAETAAVRDWKVTLDQYTLIEASAKIQPAGRKDHTFVYERQNAGVKESRFRMKIVVSGDRVTALEHYSKIPEAFFKRYEEMRSANETIAQVGQSAMAVLYILGGVIWVFVFIRQRKLLWKEALGWGALVGFLSLLGTLNYLPMYWLGYDTSMSAGTFFSNQVIGIIMQTLIDTLLVVFSFMVAETLTRVAFPGHIQFWKVWGREAASTWAVLGRTLGGYLMVPVFLAYVVGFYMFTSGRLGWWSPGSTLSDPNILSTYFTWLTPITMAFHAGFWEEMLFRAVPLASMAIIGTRFNKRNLFIGIGMVIQLLIFGSGHANYATQPAYGRVIELIVPSLMFGFLYLRFGLLTAIIMHFVYDAVLMNMSAFFTNVPGIWSDRILFLILVLIPVWVVLIRRIAHGRFGEIPEDKFNGAWVPNAGTTEEKSEQSVTTHAPVKGRTATRVGWFPLCVALVAILALTFGAGVPQEIRKQYSRPRLSDGKAVEMARNYLKTRLKTELDPAFEAFPRVAGTHETHRLYCVETLGRDVYHLLRDSFYQEATWQVTFKRFDGNLTQRTEQYIVTLSNAGDFIGYYHILPEEAVGIAIVADQARDIARKALADWYGADTAQLTEISTTPRQLPNRVDWVVTYAMPEHPLGDERARFDVTLSGDRLAGIRMYVDPPEDWERSINDDRTVTSSIRTVAMLLLGLLAVGGFVTGIVLWSRRKLNVRMFIVIAGAVFIAGVTGTLLAYRSRIGEFYPVEPYDHQMLNLWIGVILFSLFKGGFAGLLLGSAFGGKAPTTETGISRIAAVVLIIVAVGIALIPLTVYERYENLHLMNVPDYSANSVTLPWVWLLLNSLSSGLIFCGMLLFLLRVNDGLAARLGQGWIGGVAMILLMGLAFGVTLHLKYSRPPYPEYALIQGGLMSLAALALYIVHRHYGNPVLTLAGAWSVYMAMGMGNHPDTWSGKAVVGLILLGWAIIDLWKNSPCRTVSRITPGQGEH